MNERRKDNREKMTAFTPVYDRHPRVLLGYLSDLTPRGASVTGETALSVDREGWLDIEFSDALIDLRPSRVVVQARVARCTPDANNPAYFNIGFEFNEIDAHSAEVIQAILDRYDF